LNKSLRHDHRHDSYSARYSFFHRQISTRKSFAKTTIVVTGLKSTTELLQLALVSLKDLEGSFFDGQRQRAVIASTQTFCILVMEIGTFI